MSETLGSGLTTLVFDWGDTVMRDFPEYSAPMADWPRVEAVPGIASTLAALRGRCSLALASSAEVSTPADVRRALERVGLGEAFSAIFTARELGVNKTHPDFYPRVLERLDCRPEQALMTGDSYSGDVLAARRAGLRTAWYNPGGAICPDPRVPHDLELADLADLPQALEQPRLPGADECRALILQHGGNEGLLAHVQAVAWAAYRSAAALQRAGIPVNPILAQRGGLLHDLDKVESGVQGRPHGELSAELLLGRGHPALAEIARRHVITRILEPGRGPRTWEERLVFYADKLVEGSRLAGLEERMTALMARYPQYADQIQRSRPLLETLEAEICGHLGLEREAYYALLRQGAP
jgi:FMN phosphatase YigB (HAD superfamily)